MMRVGMRIPNKGMGASLTHSMGNGLGETMFFYDSLRTCGKIRREA
ncbi:MAG: hypothetical protein Fur0022_07950 [Anaerolineales bacterium]